MPGAVIGGPIVWRLHLTVPPEQVFAALDTDDGRAAFWAETADEAAGCIEFRFRNGVVHRSRILERDAPRLLVLEYFGSPARFDVDADGAGGTELRLTHEGVRAEEWAEVHAGWLNVLFPLKAWVVHGVDLRARGWGRTWDTGYADG